MTKLDAHEIFDQLDAWEQAQVDYRLTTWELLVLILLIFLTVGAIGLMVYYSPIP